MTRIWLMVYGLCFSKMVDKDGRNFRAFYYDTLGLRNVEQRKALEILLKDDPIGWLVDNNDFLVLCAK